uniref:MATH domain-containing protein n=1 Tax=Biomphalaria glabrata TaxID=6526 RepID=A0A2C9LX29_BIOGL
MSVGSTVASDGISLTLSTPKDRSDHCGYLTCNHSSQADVTFFNELKIYNIANNGSMIASLSQGKHFVSTEGGFDLKRKYLRNSQASLQLSITKPENCLFGLYLCVVDFIDEHGSKQTNTAVAGAGDRGNVSCPNDRVILKAEKSILDSLARVQKRLQKNDKLLQEKMDRGLNKTTSLIETKMEEMNTKYGHFSQAFKDLNLLEDRTKEWTLAFRGTPFIDKAVYEAYLDGTGIPFDVEIGCKV